MTPTSTAVTIDPNRGDVAVLAPDRESILTMAQVFVVDDGESLAAALELAGTCNTRIERIEKEFEKEKSLAHKLHEAICEKIRNWCSGYRAAKEIFESKAADYRRQEKEQIAEGEQRSVAQAQQRKDELLQLAAGAKKLGEMGAYRRLLADAEAVVAVVIRDEKPDVEGVSEREPWIPQSGGKNPDDLLDPESLMTLLRAIVAGEFPLEHVMKRPRRVAAAEPIIQVNESMLKYLARTREQNFSVPGFAVKQDIKFSHKKGRG